MAIMHPDSSCCPELETIISTSNTGGAWEWTVYCLLQKYLPPDWHVWWNKHQSWNGSRPPQYDFVVLVPGKGLVNLDAKGSGWTVKDGQTVCIHDGIITIQKDIFSQAEDALTTLQNVLEHTISKNWGAYAYLLAFKEQFTYSGMEKHYIEELEFTLQRNQNALVNKINALLENFSAVFPNFDRHKDKIMRHLDGECHVPQRSDDFGLKDTSGEIVLSVQQQKVLSLLDDNPNLHVVGPAGTGKTIIAMHLMRKAIAAGKRVLYVCYNKALAEDLSATNPDLVKAETGSIIVHFDAIPNRNIPGVGKMNDVINRFPQPNNNDDWTKRRKAIISVMEKRAQSYFDLLLVDEAQDLDNECIFSLFYLLKEKRKIVVFSDAKQSLFTRDWELDYTMFGNIPPKSLCLTENWRNTNKIHDHFKEFEEVEVIPIIRDHTRPVEVVANSLSALEIVLSDNRRPCDIAILCSTVEQLSVLPKKVDGPEEKPIKLVGEVSKWRQGYGILKTTIRSFKGLDAPIVILDETGLDDMSEDRYVGESRAKYELYIVRKPTEA